MNAMSPDPAAVLAKLHAETKGVADAMPSADNMADVLNERVCAIEDVLYTIPAADPAALRIQADAIRVYTRDFQHDSRVTAIMVLAASYADRLAAMDAKPAAPEPLATLRLCDATPPLLDAIGALNLAIRGLDDDADRRSLAVIADRVGEMAAAVDDLALSLHEGGAP